MFHREKLNASAKINLIGIRLITYIALGVIKTLLGLMHKASNKLIQFVITILKQNVMDFGLDNCVQFWWL